MIGIRHADHDIGDRARHACVGQRDELCLIELEAGAALDDPRLHDSGVELLDRVGKISDGKCARRGKARRGHRQLTADVQPGELRGKCLELRSGIAEVLDAYTRTTLRRYALNVQPLTARRDSHDSGTGALEPTGAREVGLDVHAMIISGPARVLESRAALLVHGLLPATGIDRVARYDNALVHGRDLHGGRVARWRDADGRAAGGAGARLPAADECLPAGIERGSLRGGAMGGAKRQHGGQHRRGTDE
jgi:hypothetical protein